jgi:hypothetical protein
MTNRHEEGDPRRSTVAMIIYKQHHGMSLNEHDYAFLAMLEARDRRERAEFIKELLKKLLVLLIIGFYVAEIYLIDYFYNR